MNSPPHAYGWLDVGNHHQLYWERHGRPGGEPWIFLHGGPAGRSHPAYIRFFDPNQHDIILFDQRGCGRSTPYGECRDNHTALLVDDIEKLRIAMALDRVNLLGVSWGSWLAHLYRTRYATACMRTVLACPFVPCPAFFRWHADVLNKALGADTDISHSTAPRLSRQLAHALSQGPPDVQQRAAHIWHRAEAIGARMPMPAAQDYNRATLAALALESHYAANIYFVGAADAMTTSASSASEHDVIVGDADVPGMMALHALQQRSTVIATVIEGLGHEAFAPRFMQVIRDSVLRSARRTSNPPMAAPSLPPHVPPAQAGT